jgi:hypothetical protein
MRKEDTWLARTNVRTKKKHAMPLSKRGRSLVAKKGSRIRKTRRNRHTKTVGEKATKLDSTKGRKNGR